MLQKDFQLTIGFIDPKLDDDELNREADRLLEALKDMDEVEEVGRVRDPDLPVGSKSGLGRFLIGLLKATINAKNCMNVMRFLGDRLRGKTISIKVEAHDKKLEVTANTVDELKAVMEQVQKFIDNNEE